DAAIYAVDGVEDILWFCRGHNLTGRWVSFNFQHDTALINKKKVYGRTVVSQVDYGTKQPQGRVTLKNASGVRFREAPVNGAVIDTFKGGEVVAFWDKVGSDGWRKIDWNGRVGYASAQYLDVTAVAPAPPPVIPEF